jgi:hypothetical protein
VAASRTSVWGSSPSSGGTSETLLGIETFLDSGWPLDKSVTLLPSIGSTVKFFAALQPIPQKYSFIMEMEMLIVRFCRPPGFAYLSSRTA